MTLSATLRRLHAAYRRRVIAAAIRSILTDTTGRHRRRVYVRKGPWMADYLRTRRTHPWACARYRRYFFEHKHRAATTPPQNGRAAPAGASPPPLAPADLSPADLARGTLGPDWIGTEIARAELLPQIAREGQTP